MASGLFALAVGGWLMLFPLWVHLGIIPRRWAGSSREMSRASYVFAVVWLEMFGLLAVLIGVALL